MYAAVGADPATPGPDADAGALRELSFDDSGMAVLKAALKEPLRFDHNYICTEHLLLGLLDADGPAAEALTAFDLTPETAESLPAAEFAKSRARRKADLE